MGQYKFVSKEAAFLWGRIASFVRVPGQGRFIDLTAGYTPTRDGSIGFQTSFDDQVTRLSSEGGGDPRALALYLAGTIETARPALVSLDAFRKSAKSGGNAFIAVDNLLHCVHLLEDLCVQRRIGKNIDVSKSAQDALKLGAHVFHLLEDAVVMIERHASGGGAIMRELWTLDRCCGITEPPAGRTPDALALAAVEQFAGPFKTRCDGVPGGLKLLLKDVSLVDAKRTADTCMNQLQDAASKIDVAFARLREAMVNGKFKVDKPSEVIQLSAAVGGFFAVVDGLAGLAIGGSDTQRALSDLWRDVRADFAGRCSEIVARTQFRCASLKTVVTPKFWPCAARADPRPGGTTRELPWDKPEAIPERHEEGDPGWFEHERTGRETSGGKE